MENIYSNISKLLNFNEIKDKEYNIGDTYILDEPQITKLIIKLINNNYFYFNDIVINNFRSAYVTINIINDLFTIYNLNIDIINNNKHNKFIIMICHIKNINHTTVFIIDNINKRLVYFDPYGIRNNSITKYELIKKYSRQIKKQLIDSQIISTNYKLIFINIGWQTLLKDDPNKWFYNSSCTILMSLFTYLYITNNGSLKYISYINKLIKTNNIENELFKKTILYMFITSYF